MSIPRRQEEVGVSEDYDELLEVEKFMQREYKELQNTKQ